MAEKQKAKDKQQTIVADCSCGATDVTLVFDGKNGLNFSDHNTPSGGKCEKSGTHHPVTCPKCEAEDIGFAQNGKEIRMTAHMKLSDEEKCLTGIGAKLSFEETVKV